MKQYMNVMGFMCRDRVTGYEGIASSISYDLYGCVQVALIPRIKKDKPKEDGHWFDHKRLEIIEKKPVMEMPNYDLAEQKAVSSPKVRGQESGPAEKPHSSRLG